MQSAHLPHTQTWVAQTGNLEKKVVAGRKKKERLYKKKSDGGVVLIVIGSQEVSGGEIIQGAR